MLSVKYYLISPQHAFNILLALYCLNCSTFVALKYQSANNSKLEIYFSPVQLIYHESRYT